ncbi:hypothetical protein JCM8547_002972 [Rhodosporidiobolus lusitaniae]
MEILSESESRSFSQFLDSFSSSAASNFVGPTLANSSSYGQEDVQQGGRRASGWQGVLRNGQAGGSAPLGGWAVPAGAGGTRRTGSAARPAGTGAGVEGQGYPGATSMSGFGYGATPLPPLPPFLPPPFPSSHPAASALRGFDAPPLSLPPRRSSSHSRYPPQSVMSGSSSIPSGPSLSNPASYPSTSNDPCPPSLFDEQKRARMAQQARELEAMMGGTGSSYTAALPADFGAPPAFRSTERGQKAAQMLSDGEEEPHGVRAGHEEDDEDEDSPPLKRSRRTSGRRRTGEESTGKEQAAANPLVRMLEEEKKAGFRSTGFVSAPPPSAQHPPAFAGPPPSLSMPSHISPPPAVVDLPPLPTAPKRKAPAAPRAKNKAKPKTSSAPATAPSVVKVEDESPSAPTSVVNLTPFPSPANIPLAPPRPSRPTDSISPSSFIKASSSSSPPPPATSTNGKPALLSAEQKKANHIASEQKRRAAIRAGYDALCDVVPALKAAVQEYEERLSAVSKTAVGIKGKGKRTKEVESKTGALMGGIEVGGEKIDGRAGPKSEAVVLSKTVDHLRHLLVTRNSLLAQLSDTYAPAAENSVSVPPGPPAGTGSPRAARLAGEWDEPWAEWMRDVEEDEEEMVQEEDEEEWDEEDVP